MEPTAGAQPERKLVEMAWDPITRIIGNLGQQLCAEFLDLGLQCTDVVWGLGRFDRGARDEVACRNRARAELFQPVS